MEKNLATTELEKKEELFNYIALLLLNYFRNFLFFVRFIIICSQALFCFYLLSDVFLYIFFHLHLLLLNNFVSTIPFLQSKQKKVGEATSNVTHIHTQRIFSFTNLIFKRQMSSIINAIFFEMKPNKYRRFNGRCFN